MTLAIFTYTCSLLANLINYLYPIDELNSQYKEAFKDFHLNSIIIGSILFIVFALIIYITLKISEKVRNNIEVLVVFFGIIIVF